VCEKRKWKCSAECVVMHAFRYKVNNAIEKLRLRVFKVKVKFGFAKAHGL
jgi:hypothetical protein